MDIYSQGLLRHQEYVTGLSLAPGLIIQLNKNLLQVNTLHLITRWANNIQLSAEETPRKQLQAASDQNNPGLRVWLEHLLMLQRLQFCFNRHLCCLPTLLMQPVLAMAEAINFFWGGSSVSFLCFLRYLPRASTETTGNINSEELGTEVKNCTKLSHNFLIYLQEKCDSLWILWAQLLWLFIAEKN